jgi:hypothetical protein
VSRRQVIPITVLSDLGLATLNLQIQLRLSALIATVDSGRMTGYSSIIAIR